MFTELNELLEIDLHNINNNEMILVHERNNDGSFILHHFLSFYLKNHRKVCLLTLAQSGSHYTNVSTKFGLTLNAEVSKGNLVIIEGLKHIGNQITRAATAAATDSDHASMESDVYIDFNNGNKYHSLKPLYKHIMQKIREIFGVKEQVLLIIDDLSFLSAIGIPSMDIIYFLQYLRQEQIEEFNIHRYQVLALIHQDADVDDSDLIQLLTFARLNCDLHLTTQDLKSGTCDAVDGQVST